MVSFWRRRRDAEPDEPADAPTGIDDAPTGIDGAASAADAPTSIDGGETPGDSVDVGPPADLDSGLARTRGGFMSRLRGFFGAGEAVDWEDVEETLIGGDVGPRLAAEIVERARRRHDLAPEAAVRAELAALLAPREPGWEPAQVPGGPAIILVVGFNATGKTTTMG